MCYAIHVGIDSWCCFSSSVGRQCKIGGLTLIDCAPKSAPFVSSSATRRRAGLKEASSHTLLKVIGILCQGHDGTFLLLGGNSIGSFGRLNNGLNHCLTHPQPEVAHL